MTIKFSSFVASASFLLLCSVSAAALADGMPFEQPAPKQNLKPIDKSLTAVPSAPAVTTTAPAAPAPAPEAAAAPALAPLPPPVPESRTVDVQPNTSFFGLSVGLYDPLTHGSTSTAFNVEWQPGIKIVGTLQPLFGAMATTRGALLGYAGVGMPFNITEHVFVMPSLSLGGYKPGGDYDLSRTIVARPGIELAYQFDDKSRLGLNFDVLTNAKSLQARDRTEMIALTYTMPLNALSGSDASAMPAPASEAPAAVAPTQTTAPAQTIVIPPAGAPATTAPAAAPASKPATVKPLPHELP